MTGGEDDGNALWEAVKKTVSPLRKLRPSAEAKLEVSEKRHKPAAKRKAVQAVPIAPAPRAPSLPPLTHLDRRARARIAR
ncbi:MAG TPA: DNA mismatch repair protein MutS, partial [Xanthobacteraceae bacterium]|nr:DNA mismatch repair protein MutS [Xanthobacteraceae bacterium]